MAATLLEISYCGLKSLGDDRETPRWRSRDLLWQDDFRDPSPWWDNRNSKSGPAYPDFKHKVSNEALWLDSWHTPTWVPGELTRKDAELCQEDENASAFMALLRTCAKNKDLNMGIRIHDYVLKSGLLEMCCDGLVSMYAKCSALVTAKGLLDMHRTRNVYSWNALIAGYVREGQAQSALDCFEMMQEEGIAADAVTFACILKACGSVRALDKGKQIHDEIARQGLLGHDTVLGNALVDMYVKCKALADARQVLEELPSRDVVSWSALIAGYAQQGQAEQALKCYAEMQKEGLSPNAVTFSCILKACSSIRAINKGEDIHVEIRRQGLLANNLVLGTALVNMYAKCGGFVKARRVLEDLCCRDIVSWNALIAGYAQHGHGNEALQCFEEMQCEGLIPDMVTFTSILKACGSIRAVDRGEQIHVEVAKLGLLQRNVALGNAIVDMYAKCGALAKARNVLKNLPSRGLVAWSSIISGYAQQGQGEQAVSCYEQMQCEGLSPDVVTYACILKACGSIGAADKGREVHIKIARQGLLEGNIVLGNALVDMYVKCGALATARRVLEELPSRDIVSWSALLTGYAQQGQGEKALSCFEQMELEGIRPDAIAFACVLNACCQQGLLEHGLMFFVGMSTKYGIKPNLEHYTCMIDLFGSVGQLQKVVVMIQEMTPSDNSAVWSALLNACWKWVDVKVGSWAFEQVVWLNQTDGAPYIIMANIFTSLGMEENAKSIEAMRRQNTG